MKKVSIFGIYIYYCGCFSFIHYHFLLYYKNSTRFSLIIQLEDSTAIFYLESSIDNNHNLTLITLEAM